MNLLLRYAADVVRNHCGNSIYGVCLYLDDMRNDTKANKEAKKKLEAFEIVLKKACPDEWEKATYHIAVTGDFECCATVKISGK